MVVRWISSSVMQLWSSLVHRSRWLHPSRPRCGLCPSDARGHGWSESEMARRRHPRAQDANWDPSWTIGGWDLRVGEALRLHRHWSHRKHGEPHRIGACRGWSLSLASSAIFFLKTPLKKQGSLTSSPTSFVSRCSLGIFREKPIGGLLRYPSLHLLLESRRNKGSTLYPIQMLCDFFILPSLYILLIDSVFDRLPYDVSEPRISFSITWKTSLLSLNALTHGF